MFKHINLGTKIRTIALVIAFINQLLVVFGYSPIPLDEQVLNDVVVQLDLLVATVLTVGTSLWSWFKDNDVTRKRVEEKKEAGL